jgi:hypothetical protein
MEITSAVRKNVELNPDGSLFKFDSLLLPPEGKEASVLAQGGVVEEEIDPQLRDLISETRDFLEWYLQILI